MKEKEEFIAIFRENIKREGSDKLLEYLRSTDFFQAPASSRFHNAYEGGLCNHSVNVYRRLKALVDSEDSLYKKYSDESIAIIGLLHDLCKANFYIVDYRKVKEDDVWITKPYYKFNEIFPYGHGEKSVYLIQQFMKLTDEEAMAINWHMGPYDDRAKGGSYSFDQVFHRYPICFLTHIADSLASYLDEPYGVE